MEFQPTYMYTDPNTLYHNGGDQMNHATIFNQYFEGFMAKANNFAKEVLGKKREPIFGREDARPARCCSNLSAIALGNPSSSYGNTYINNSSSNVFVGGGGRGNSKDDTAAALCMLGTMVFIAASTAFGYFFANYQNTKDEIKNKDDFESYLKQFNIAPQFENAYIHLQEIRNIFFEYTHLLHDRLERDRANCYTAVVLIVSSGVLGIGGALSSSAMMIIGGSALVATAAVTGFRVMYECQRQSRIPEYAQNIVQRYNNIKKIGLHA